MDARQKFQDRLQDSFDEFLWAVSLIPQDRFYRAPRPNRWSVARLVFHLTSYEEKIALPTMRQWCGEPKPHAGSQEEDGQIEERLWNNGEGHEMPAMIERLKIVRAQEISLLNQLAEASLDEEREAIWGTLPLRWIVTKTYQHTLEHTDEILRSYLWWR
ncbi:MAG TPA: DinB family protein [Ktedonobacteraceae bacterium]